MPIDIRDDVVYIMLKKIDECDRGPGPDEVNFSETDFAGLKITPKDVLGHLDYLNQRQYINAEFTGNAYGNQEDVPDAVAPKEFDFRIANSFGAADGPLPHLISFKKAELTEKGRQMLDEMNADPPKALESGPAVPIADKDSPFLERVMVKANLTDLYDARDITEVVFRTMRDMMTNEAVDRVAEELHEPMEPTDEKALQNEVADLWIDTNPLVRFLSRVRPPLIIKEDTFLFRIRQEAGIPQETDVDTVLKAVFSAAKDELSEDRIKEIAEFLPGKIRQMWDHA
ncbi:MULTISPECIES: DUF2267 domain-containing protein [Trichocoleus]|uniref:DUF2267 domain-containing protein n=1 Tax=Trichocoleus desertorum GB2-A4 TaxID=2933944 RepID=A0ABV0J958_9CYAN|nr:MULTISPECIES: DUF2267 domain-containing protein [unclassified Trichocoleus]MBD1864699.1 DUF2267 domain-containing protein [Trichocoleus sp. FACHB-46]MBD2098391.1 DUF2267 domain-containing protein [Trichocoleus sp. FACHB-591]MBD2120404.1 DUF2267 domain-containing protein [Trichocoleus sp. FACHB-262]